MKAIFFNMIDTILESAEMSKEELFEELGIDPI